MTIFINPMSVPTPKQIRIKIVFHFQLNYSFFGFSMSHFFVKTSVSKWLTSKTMHHYKDKGVEFHFPQSPVQQLLREHAEELTTLVSLGQILKDHAGTTASLITLSDQLLFIKRVDYRQKKFTNNLKYFFFPPRSYVAAMAADMLHEAAIHTPQVFGVGQFQQYGMLKESYILTEALPHARFVSKHIEEGLADPWDLMKQIALVIRRLHDNRMYHGDLKMTNLYFDRGTLGIWDLDSFQCFESDVDMKLKRKDVGRAISSILMSLDLSPKAEHRELLTHANDCINYFCEAYGIDSQLISESMQSYWLKKHQFSTPFSL